MYPVFTDRDGNKYIEVPVVSTGEATRLTLVQSGRLMGAPAVRVQHHGLGDPEPGPDVPVDSFGNVVSAIVQLLTDGR